MSECWLRRQTYAAFWVGVDARASELVVRRSCIKGLLFQDWCFIAPNETARQVHRYPDKMLPACERSGQAHTASNYYRYAQNVRFPAVFVC